MRETRSTATTLDRPPLEEVEWMVRLTKLPAHRIYDYVRQGRIPAVRLGRRILFDPVRIDRWLDEGGIGIGDDLPPAA